MLKLTIILIIFSQVLYSQTSTLNFQPLRYQIQAFPNIYPDKAETIREIIAPAPVLKVRLRATIEPENCTLMCVVTHRIKE